ncbi:hypothetical protein MPTK1_1g01500 [Marchantia polymorpha subsp. ruderalis]|uniref:Uncharacterized protein n=2 Tax=Marchantia polymorpha TaxID=3197 RepID=A0AAF6AKE2_MARPO|nr:hypothetical protein MARPO_0029s0097 [Marchantia polymorpha]BBM96912.1 hypothetical protein Mp_1g01500 [Marchantia polymorpha subsp. ruderalis]|eukprot:PTQ42571.1 hypothetical protein MARPO_0029s0097 [Marchantia polymorpha]
MKAGSVQINERVGPDSEKPIQRLCKNVKLVINLDVRVLVWIRENVHPTLRREKGEAEGKCVCAGPAFDCGGCRQGKILGLCIWFHVFCHWHSCASRPVRSRHLTTAYATHEKAIASLNILHPTTLPTVSTPWSCKKGASE